MTTHRVVATRVCTFSLNQSDVRQSLLSYLTNFRPTNDLYSARSHQSTSYNPHSRVGDFPRSNADVQLSTGLGATAHVYNTPQRPASIAIATVGTFQDNKKAVKATYGKLGDFRVNGKLMRGVRPQGSRKRSANP
jgi:hypothetical protein